MEINIRFNVVGVCTQTINVYDDCPLSKEEIISNLNGDGDKTVCTTVQENGDLVWIKDDGEMKVIGRVISSDMDADYEEFGDADKPISDDEDYFDPADLY